MFTGIEAVLFDLDGTLLDSAPDLAAAANKMRTDRGMIELPCGSFRSMVGTGARGMLSVAFDMNPADDDFEAMKLEFFANYEKCLIQQTVAFAGVSEVIAKIKLAEIKWAVVTNKSQRFTKPLTDAMSLFSSAGTVVSGDTTPYSKPHPAPLLEAASRLGIPPENCLYVGDDERDIIAGRAAGMQTVAAAYGYLGKDADILSWKADAIILFPLDILKLLGLA